MCQPLKAAISSGKEGAGNEEDWDLVFVCILHFLLHAQVGIGSEGKRKRSSVGLVVAEGIKDLPAVPALCTDNWGVENWGVERKEKNGKS